MRKDILTSPFRVQVTPQLPKPEPNQSAPLFLPGAWKKKERRGIYSGQFLTCTRSRHMSYLIETPEDRQWGTLIIH